MKLEITLNRIFNADHVDDYMDVNQDDDVLEFFAVWHNPEDDTDNEPDYFVRVYNNGEYKVNDLSGKVLYKGTDKKEMIKVLKNI